MERIVREALERVASDDASEAILAGALRVQGEGGFPAHPPRLSAFITGPLYDAVEARLGGTVASAVLADLAPLVERASSQLQSGVRRADGLSVAEMERPVMLVATVDRDRVEALGLAAEGFVVRWVDDVFALLQGVEAYENTELSVIVDGRLPSIHAGTLVALARVLPERARVVLWGVDDYGDPRLGWSRLPREAEEAHVLAAVRGELREADTLPPPEMQSCGSARVVLADGDPTYRARLAGVLRDRGHRVRTAPDGYAALHLCVERTPDLIVADRDVPVVDGGQLARLVRDMLGDHAPPVVVVTSRRLTEIVGVSRVVSKDEEMSELVALLEQTLVDRAQR